ncbi:uncharacterized protein K489DRAFT_68630 [Dissoconium aciculare CBS 342.82]|uniref:Uncharacterized protein n=1 Tax=Dissoconium aciculare CBS 342.82 TaxID=1314786 RepID=A0A6J3LY21_9PEZI|nr:uncharacterized protein K489DRAFT_68630 [Dissoconium aciculare CBS 342.82]KAF1819537.1 hypothetical protein K489DRAFT_68630 [Dissoconium aciculare CBS 342.82]
MNSQPQYLGNRAASIDRTRVFPRQRWPGTVRQKKKISPRLQPTGIQKLATRVHMDFASRGSRLSRKSIRCRGLQTTMMMAMTMTKDFDDTEEELRSGGRESMLRSRGIVTFSRLTVRVVNTVQTNSQGEEFQYSGSAGRYSVHRNRICPVI